MRLRSTSEPLMEVLKMQTLVKNIGKFKGDLRQGRRDYERAKQGLEVIEAEASQLEGTLKAETGFDRFNLPREVTETELQLGEVDFVVRSETRTKRPQYKAVVQQMEGYIMGISFMLSQGRTITGVAKEGRSWYVATDKLLEAYEVMAYGVMLPEVKQTIKHKAKGIVIDDVVLEDDRDSAELTPDNGLNYAKMKKLRPTLAKYVKGYEAELAEGQEEGERTTEITSRSAYKTKKSTANGVDWGYVVQTMVTVPTHPDEEGELNVLADHDLSKAEKVRDMPWYKVINREPNGETRLYVSIQSVYERIQQLKADETITAQRLDVAPKEVV